MTVGNHFWCNGDCFFNCTTRITLGNNNMYGWNVSFITSDGHHVFENGNENPMEGDIIIGNHVWIASNCTIAKSVCVADDNVIAQYSLVNRKYSIPSCLIGGMPAKILKNYYLWKG